MKWSICWYIATAMAWVASLTGAVWWGDDAPTSYAFSLTLTIGLTVVALNRWNTDRGRQASWRAGWTAREATNEARPKPAAATSNVRAFRKPGQAS